MLKLYHNDMSSCAQKVRITLAEKGLPWEGFHLSLRKGEARTEEYKKLNPNGVVPTLITENGTVIIESTVILEYLDDAYPDIPLKPDDPIARARMRLWTKKLDEGIHVNLATVSNAVAFRYQHIEGRSQEELQAYFNGIPDPERRARTIDLVSHGTNSKYFGPAIHCFDTLFAEMDAALEQGYMANRVTILPSRHCIYALPYALRSPWPLGHPKSPSPFETLVSSRHRFTSPTPLGLEIGLMTRICPLWPRRAQKPRPV